MAPSHRDLPPKRRAMFRSTVETELGLEEEIGVVSSHLDSETGFCNMDPTTRKLYRIREPTDWDRANAAVIPTLIVNVPRGRSTKQHWMEQEVWVEDEAPNSQNGGNDKEEKRNFEHYTMVSHWFAPREITVPRRIKRNRTLQLRELAGGDWRWSTTDGKHPLLINPSFPGLYQTSLQEGTPCVGRDNESSVAITTQTERRSSFQRQRSGCLTCRGRYLPVARPSSQCLLANQQTARSDVTNAIQYATLVAARTLSVEERTPDSHESKADRENWSKIDYM
ncbi:hypothetical protein SCUP234_03364 [Seiridium cupressi]